MSAGRYTDAELAAEFGDHSDIYGPAGGKAAHRPNCITLQDPEDKTWECDCGLITPSWKRGSAGDYVPDDALCVCGHVIAAHDGWIKGRGALYCLTYPCSCHGFEAGDKAEAPRHSLDGVTALDGGIVTPEDVAYVRRQELLTALGKLRVRAAELDIPTAALTTENLLALIDGERVSRPAHEDEALVSAGDKAEAPRNRWR